jgi:hypothetical protein
LRLPYLTKRRVVAMTPFQKASHRKLRSLIDSHGVTIAEAARMLDYNVGHMEHLYRGRRPVQLIALRLLERLLQESAAERSDAARTA